MIKVNYSGGLGNTLLQYSMGRILAEEMGTALVANHISGFEGTKDLVNEEKSHKNNRYTQLTNQIVNVDEITKLEYMDIILGTMGFFQRFEYYKPYKEKIRQWLRTDYYDVGQTKNDAIIHLRLGDCILGDLAEHPYVMPPEYYHKALDSIDFEQLYICSDPETLNHEMFQRYMETLKEYRPKLVGGDTIEDFNAIKSFNKIIMSQSTFSWFAAFLSEASEIFVPVPEGGHHGHEWSIESPGVALFVDDEDRYSYVKQYENDWKIVNLQDIEEI